MNLRLILAVSLLLIPFVVKGQATSPDIIFYSEGKMHVGKNYTTSTDPSLYIDGSTKFSSVSANSTRVEQVGVTKLTGDFIDALINRAAVDSLFTENSKTGVVWFAGKDILQRIYRDKDIAKENSTKAKNYINFPTLRVNQDINLATSDLGKVGYVAVDTSASISVSNLEIGGAAGYKGGFAINASYIPTATNRVKSAYALIKDINNGDPVSSGGWSRVNLVLSDSTNLATVNPDYKSGAVTDDKLRRRYLTGFSSPFAELGADYMLFNVLLRPNHTSITSNQGPELSPRFKLVAGKGYFIAQNLTAFDWNIIESGHGINRQKRFYQDYEFSRKVFKDHYSKTGGYKDNFAKLGIDEVKEYFNTGKTKVTVELEKGLNFLGNPFMAPLDLSSIVGKAEGQVPGAASYTAGAFARYTDTNQPLVASTNNQATANGHEIRAKYWIVNDASIRYERALNADWFYYNVKSYTAQTEGATVDLIGNAKHLIAPMAMFCIQAAAKFSIDIQQPTVATLTAGYSVAPKAAVNTVDDELLIQALDIETGEEDRTCLVFRDKTMVSKDYDYVKTYKNFTKDIENNKWFVLTEGAVFTKRDDGEPLLSNAVPKDIKQIALYVVPPTDRVKHIKLKPYRMESLQSINKVWVEDKLNPGVYEELTPEGLDYVLEPTSDNTKVSLSNRFVLYFNELPNGNGGTGVGDDAFKVYYYGSNLIIEGLIDNDKGSKVDIYDIQGRLVAQTAITDVPKMTFPKALAHGTYIVKIKGNRNHTSKFISLQNQR